MSFRRLFISIMSAFFVFSLLPHASAQNKGGSGLSISPTRAELIIKPGAADNVQITLKNISGIDITARVDVNDFRADNITSEPKLLVNTKNDEVTSIKKFLVGVENIVLKKDETKKFDIPVQIPVGTTSGAYYGVIRYTAVADNKEEAAAKQVSLNASLGMIVLIQVPGNITEQLQAVKVTTQRNNINGSVFIAPPQRASVTLKNTGNGFTKPFGRVVITKGGKEVYSYEMNNTDPRSSILPGATRTFTDDIKNVSALGRYTISSSTAYGTGGDVLILKSSFWVFPLWFVIVAISVLLLVAVVGYSLHRKVNRSHRRK